MTIAIIDRNGVPLVEGARIQYRVPDFYINAKTGTGIVRSVDQYGGVYYLADKPEPVRENRCGQYREERREQYTAVWTYDARKNARITESTLDDERTFIEVIT